MREPDTPTMPRRPFVTKPKRRRCLLQAPRNYNTKCSPVDKTSNSRRQARRLVPATPTRAMSYKTELSQPRCHMKVEGRKVKDARSATTTSGTRQESTP